MVSACMQHFQHQKVNKQQSNAGIYRVPDSIRFDQVQITDVPELVMVRLWLDHTITGCLILLVARPSEPDVQQTPSGPGSTHQQVHSRPGAMVPWCSMHG